MWTERLHNIIENEDLRNWVGSVIWWQLGSTWNKLETESQIFDWQLFMENFVDTYNPKHTFEKIDLMRGLKTVGFIV